MRNQCWARALAACAILSTSLLAGDYGHVLDVVQKAWPERTKGMAICSLEANQFALLDLVDTAKERGLSLVIVHLKDARDLDATLKTALMRHPDFVLIIDEDPILGSKGVSLSRLVGRAAAMGIPAVGLAPDLLNCGGAVAVAAATEAKVQYNAEVLKQLKLAVPEAAVAFTVK